MTEAGIELLKANKAIEVESKIKSANTAPMNIPTTLAELPPDVQWIVQWALTCNVETRKALKVR